uniref:Photosystem II reaction center protein Psb30 n=1 Tax=Picocystis salinarum TaxID=88271 RepID=A0A088CKA1_9CHLO|nr:hypothetical chloroplast RF12 [Picocystis salinarum]AID67654.1 hypothetical chloroplast RF12 [Picocystis salinarum]
MNFEVLAQLASLGLILISGPIVILLLSVRQGNL